LSQSINSKGDIAGSDIDINDQTHGFLRTSDGRITVFEAPGAGSLGTVVAYGSSINAARTITGWYYDSMTVMHGFVRASGGKITRFDAPGAGKGPQQGTMGASITPTGMILLDDSDKNSVSHGFLRSTSGKITRLPDAPGEGKGIGQGTYPSMRDCLRAEIHVTNLNLWKWFHLPRNAFRSKARDGAVGCDCTKFWRATTMDDKLARRQADRNALSNLSLTPWENTLAREICLTRVNAKACR
jgi:hypothetical protein